MMGFLLQRYRRFLIAFIILVIFLTVIRLLAPDAIVAYRTAYIISHVVPAVPEWFERGSYEVELRQERDDIDIYIPKGIERTSFVIFFPGFNPDGARDPRIVNLARAFAGAGIGAAVPDSKSIREREFLRDDIDLVKETFYFLQDQPYVDADRIGLSGFSIAGSYILRAASELGARPVFVHSLGGSYDLQELFAEILSKNAIYKGEKRAWEPDSLPKEIVRQIIIEHMAEEKKDQVLARKEIGYEEARQYIQFLSEDFLATIDNISPSSSINDMKTRVYLMHDRNDNLIPVEGSRKIRDALPKDIPVSYSEFSLFQHVTPQLFLSIDILKLSGQMFNIMKLLLWK